MPIQMNEENGGSVCFLRVSGELVKADYGHFVSEFEQLVRKNGKLRVLFDMSDFHGWDAGALWEDIKFDIEHFADIDQIAAVGDKKWQHRMMEFFEPFTKATIRYFDRGDVAAARKWLGES
jgi:hypothetical protein